MSSFCRYAIPAPQYRRVASAIVLPVLAGFGWQKATANATDRYLNTLLWSATDIVVVTEGDRIDDKFEVVTVWRGNMKKGAELSIRWFSVPTNQPHTRIPTPQRPYVPRGGKMIYLLSKVPPSEPVYVRSSAGTWMGAGGEQFETSIISICERNGRVSAILPGIPQDLSNVEIRSNIDGMREPPMTRREWTTLSHFRKQVDACSQVRKPLTKIETIRDPKLRASKIIPLLTWTGEGSNEAHLMRQRAFWALLGCGDSAIPHLRALLRDGTYTEVSREQIFRVMKAKDPKTIGPVFVEMLEEDLKIWSAIDGVQDRRHALDRRYQTDRLLIRYLAVSGFQESRQAIQRTLEFWRDAPELEKAVSGSNTTGFCEAALQALDARANGEPLANDVLRTIGLYAGRTGLHFRRKR